MRKTSSLIVIAFVALYWCVFIFITEQVLESHVLSESHSLHDVVLSAPRSLRHINNDDSNLSKPSVEDPRYLIFGKDIPKLQGLGNILNGLLAAHLLAYESNRTLCVTPDFVHFHAAFEPRDTTLCPTVYPPPLPQNTLRMLNYESQPVNECRIKDLLVSGVHAVYYVGNTYPRWPTVPSQFFLRYYQPTPALLAILPFPSQTPPAVVVHLRKGDDRGDVRGGLDGDTLRVLGETLSKDTFLITNYVKWYDYYGECCGWRNPGWDGVWHSAVNQFRWGRNQKDGSPKDVQGNQKKKMQISHQAQFETHTDQELIDRQNLQMFSDWYTLLLSQTLYHTHSDFSQSALHFMGRTDGRVIHGLKPVGNTKVLDLRKELWLVDGDAEFLVHRTINDLQHCSN